MVPEMFCSALCFYLGLVYVHTRNDLGPIIIPSPPLHVDEDCLLPLQTDPWEVATGNNLR